MKSYSAIDKILHNLVFRNKIINRSLFEIEKIMYSRKKNINLLQVCHVLELQVY